jgi:hypothetical protein
MVPKIAVIGSGPVALTCIEELIDRGHLPDVYLPLENNSHREPLLHNQLIVKDRFSKPHLYYQSREIEPLYQDHTSIYEINRLGGLTEVWGGVFLPSHPIENSFTELSAEQAKSLTKEVLIKRKYLGEESLIHEYLNPEAKLTFESDKVPLFQDRESSEIWSARKDFKELLRRWTINVNGPAIKFIQTEDKTKIAYRNDSNMEILSDGYDWVFIGAGPIGDARMILNSLDAPIDLTVQDTSVFYTLRLGKNKERGFNRLVPIFIRANFSGQNVSYSQEYSISQQLISALRFKRAHRALSFLSKLLRSWVTIEMNFCPQEKSVSLNVSRVQGNVLVQAKKRFPIFLIKPQVSLRPFNFAKGLGLRSAAGSGQHSGAFVSNNVEGSFLNSRIETLMPRISFLGASSLRNLPTGPITLAAMTNSLSVTRRILERL